MEIDNTLLIGTCRIKRMLAFMDESLKPSFFQISTHTHYCAETKQMLEYIQGSKLPEELLGVIIDDINVGKLNSYTEVNKWRENTLADLNKSEKVIIEISSLKNFLLRAKPYFFGNLTALKSIIGTNSRIAKFIPQDKLKMEFSDLKPVLSTENQIIEIMKEIKLLLPNKQILWLSHFRYIINKKDIEIEERLKLSKWVKNGSKLLGDDYFDQTVIVDKLGVKNALIDSSHYSEEAERLMALVISTWVKGQGILSWEQSDYYEKLGNQVSAKDRKKVILEKIKILQLKKKHLEVVNLYKELINYDANNMKYYFTLIGQALLGNDFHSATLYLTKMKELEGDNTLYLLAQGRFHYKVKEFDKMRQIFSLLLDSTSFQDEAFEKIFNSYIIEKNFEALSSILEKEIPLFLASYKLDFFKGKYYFLTRNFEKAKTHFKASSKEEKSYEQNYIWIVKCNLKSEDYAMANESLLYARINVKNKNYTIQLDKLEEQIKLLNSRVLLIGTCRIKRMRAFIEDNSVKSRIAQISSHVHYANEINQMLEYITYKKEIPLDLIGLVIDDINVGKLKSFEEVEEWRKYTNLLLENSKKVIIEISSIKKFELTKIDKIYGNLTSIRTVIKRKYRFSEYIEAKSLQKKYKNIEPIYSNEEEIKEIMLKVKNFFPNVKILWVNHFRYKIEGSVQEIGERKKLQGWISKYAEELEDDYLDQTRLIDKLGQKIGLKDASHYTEESERLMAKIITFWVKESRVPEMNEI